MEILEQILTKENLNKAYKKVKANKGAPGVDGVSVDDVYQQIVDNKSQILNQIRKRKYTPQPVRRVRIPKENGKINPNAHLTRAQAAQILMSLLEYRGKLPR